MRTVLPILFGCLLCSISLNAQPCGPGTPMTAISLTYGVAPNGPATNMPIVPLYWNRYYKLNIVTGLLENTGCAYTGDPNITSFGACVCILTGSYFRRLTLPCDPSPCGLDPAPTEIPRTDDNTPSGNWSSGATWIGGTVPILNSSPAVLVTKSAIIDQDLLLPPGFFLIFAGGNSTIAAGSSVQSNSAIQVYPGATLQNEGTISGSGHVYGNVVNNGKLSPGNSPGMFTITGNYTAGAAAIHEIELAAADQYDTILIDKDSSAPGGTAILGGTLQVVLLNGFKPAPGTSFAIMRFNSASGEFSTLNLPPLQPGLLWTVNYNSNDVTLTVTGSLVPLTITSINAYKKQAGVEVSWTTDNEINVKEYIVERSADAVSFLPIGHVNGRGSLVNQYAWFDASPTPSTNYYRLKAIDIDGKFMYSVVRAVAANGRGAISVYPNPVRKGQPVRVLSAAGMPDKVEVYTLTGQLLYRQAKVQSNNFMLALPSSISSGIYILHIYSGGVAEKQKLVVQ